MCLAAWRMSWSLMWAAELGPELTEHMQACIQKCKGTSGSEQGRKRSGRWRRAGNLNAELSRFHTRMDVFVLSSMTLSFFHISAWNECKTMLAHLTKFLLFLLLSVSALCIFYLLRWFWNKSPGKFSCTSVTFWLPNQSITHEEAPQYELILFCSASHPWVIASLCFYS